MNTGGNDCGIRISAVICTYRRTDTLGMAIESVIKQSLPSNEYEIIIVDNNSGDDTPEIVRRYMTDTSSNVNYILETSQGLSYARNTGVKHAQGKIVAFMDDDAEAAPEWLEALLSGYDSLSDAWVIGGKVLPIWDGERPEWLFNELASNHLSLLDWGNEVRRLDKVHPTGVNCSFKREVFDAVGYFPVDLGRIGKSLLAGEEAELTRKVHQLGKGVYYLPRALVYHHVAKDRLTKQYFRQRVYWSGWSRAIYERRTFGTKFALKKTAPIIQSLPIRLLRMLKHWGQQDEKGNLFQQEVKLRQEVGYVLGLARTLLRDREAS